MNSSTPLNLSSPGAAPGNGAPIGPVRIAHAPALDRIRPVLVHRPAERLRDSDSRRTKIWELAPTLHCSIVGTCLTTADLRALVRKFAVIPNENPSDHNLHSIAVAAVGKHDLLAKQFNKALDRRHKTAIHEFGQARTAEALGALWDAAVQRGDIPGAYWALLSHPCASETLIKRVFGDVHMLSHLVGAANRADIRRLRLLEEENAALEEKVARQQQHLHDAIASREVRIRELSAALAARLASEVPLADPGGQSSEVETLTQLVADVRRQLDAETSRRERLEQKLKDAAAAGDDRARLRLQEDVTRLRDELEIVEGRLAAWLGGGSEPESSRLDLAGTTVLYVGGLTHHVARLRLLVERASGRFLHHDGGVEEKTDLLPGLVSRADVAVFPVDCVSHEAAQTVKRLCRQSAKTYVPLRSSSLASLLCALRSPVLSREHA
ncbi:MAG: DUF2325 domain-containing protein [Alphaproteobacteria bacterium]|nr:DUF2325 domain-containing protein [Alphaproteobacteria bacterium]